MEVYHHRIQTLVELKRTEDKILPCYIPECLNFWKHIFPRREELHLQTANSPVEKMNFEDIVRRAVASINFRLKSKLLVGSSLDKKFRE